jgi:hypothetical protein
MSRTLFGGMATQALSYLGGKSTNPYQQHVSMDERLRWAQVADSNMTGNIYVVSFIMKLTQDSLIRRDFIVASLIFTAKRPHEYAH